MKKSDFDKNIKIYSIASNHYQGLSLKSILYTPIPYRIPVAFAETENSANDIVKRSKKLLHIMIRLILNSGMHY